MPKTSLYTQQITQHYPNLRIETIAFNQDGQYNDVLIVNDALVFRFAKVAPAIKTLQQEIIIQKSLQNHISLAIPNPIYHNVNTDVVGEAFVGYEMIPGKPLWVENFKSIIDPNKIKKIAAQLAGFLKELHHVSVNEIIPSIKLPQGDTRQEWANLYNRIQSKLFSHMRSNARLQTREHFESFLNNPEIFEFNPVLRHGDFGTGNIIYDPTNTSIQGIIDFGGTQLGDPAIDFAGLYISYGQAFYDQCASVYPLMENALNRVHFYCGTFALQEALFGIEHDDKEAFQSGIADYL